MRDNNDAVDANKIEAVKVIATGKHSVIDINDSKVKTKIQLAQGLKDKLILPGGKK